MGESKRVYFLVSEKEEYTASLMSQDRDIESPKIFRLCLQNPSAGVSDPVIFMLDHQTCNQAKVIRRQSNMAGQGKLFAFCFEDILTSEYR